MLDTALLVAAKPLLVGLLDLIEYKFFNPEVFRIHNFPDIVPNMKPGAWAAFVSGVKVSWFLYLPLVSIYYFINADIFSLYFYMTTIGSFTGLVGYMAWDTYLISTNQGKNFLNPFRYHEMFYLVLVSAEIGSLAGVLL